MKSEVRNKKYLSIERPRGTGVFWYLILYSSSLKIELSKISLFYKIFLEGMAY